MSPGQRFSMDDPLSTLNAAVASYDQHVTGSPARAALEKVCELVEAVQLIPAPESADGGAYVYLHVQDARDILKAAKAVAPHG